MEIYYGIEQLPALNNVVMTIGTFDGVHKGHQSILRSVVHAARELGGTSVLVTFDPHPRKLIFPNESLKLLTSLPERLQLVAQTGIDVVVVVPFTQAFASQSAAAYVQDFLVRYFQPSVIIIGYDHRFGHDRTGDLQMLRDCSSTYHFSVREISAQLIDQAAVSSTKIRKALEEGRVELAATMLGRPFVLGAQVIQGLQLGRTIGFPTANLAHWDPDKLIPQNGVYAVRVQLGKDEHLGMLNLGHNPTLGLDESLKIEVHIFDFDDNIYNQPIQVAFCARIREERKFAHLEELKAQLAQDKATAFDLLGQE